MILIVSVAFPNSLANEQWDCGKVEADLFVPECSTEDIHIDRWVDHNNNGWFKISIKKMVYITGIIFHEISKCVYCNI